MDLYVNFIIASERYSIHHQYVVPTVVVPMWIHVLVNKVSLVLNAKVIHAWVLYSIKHLFVRLTGLV